MRITGGTLRSRHIISPGGRDARPTSGRVRESLFSIIKSDVEDSCVLDLYAGPGTLGIEALSRGASFVTFVEKSRKVAGVLKGNLADLDVVERASIQIADVPKAIGRMSLRGARFGVVFMDPPYSGRLAGETLVAVAEGGIVAEEGIVVVEHSKRDRMRAGHGDLVLERVLEFGETHVSIYRRR